MFTSLSQVKLVIIFRMTYLFSPFGKCNVNSAARWHYLLPQKSRLGVKKGRWWNDKDKVENASRRDASSPLSTVDFWVTPLCQKLRRETFLTQMFVVFLFFLIFASAFPDFSAPELRWEQCRHKLLRVLCARWFYLRFPFFAASLYCIHNRIPGHSIQKSWV